MKILRALPILMICFFTLAKSALAAPEVQQIYFCGLAKINPENGTEFPSSTEFGDSVAFYQKRLLRGEVRIFEVESKTLESKMTRIPAMLQITHIGAELRARGVEFGKDNCIYSFTIHGTKGKAISTLFSDYGGYSIGVSPVVNIGYKYLSNDHDEYVSSMESILVGFGINLSSYIKFELRAGTKQTDQVEVSDVKTGAKTILTKEQALSIVLP